MKRTILRVPPGTTVEDDPRIDAVIETDEVDEPVLDTQVIESIPGEVVGRDKISQDSLDHVFAAFEGYNDAKLNDDLQSQVDSLEVIAAHMWNVVSGVDLGSAHVPEEESTDDSTSA